MLAFNAKTTTRNWRGEKDDERRISGGGRACTHAFAEQPLVDADTAKHRPDAAVVWHYPGRLAALPWPDSGRVDHLAAAPALTRNA
ncbi:hypothetical protein D3C76_906370 [compost metagenome]